MKLARIKEINRGKNGKVGNVIIETAHGRTLNRPVNVLYSLEVDEMGTQIVNHQFKNNHYNEQNQKDLLLQEQEAR